MSSRGEKNRRRKKSIAFCAVVQHELPGLFPKEPPFPVLAVGVHRELKEKFPAAPGYVIRCFLGWWCSRIRYLRAIAAENSVRLHLDGSLSEPVTEDQRQHAKEQLAAINARRRKNDKDTEAKEAAPEAR